jgi:hypothetical protein
VHAGFGQIEIIVQILQLLAQRGQMAFSFHNFDFAPGENFVQTSGLCFPKLLTGRRPVPHNATR